MTSPSEPPEDEPSEAHLALLAVLLPIVALALTRLNAGWPNVAEARLGDLASPDVIEECKTIIRESLPARPSPTVAQAIDDVEKVLIEQVKRARVLAVNASTLTQALDAIQALDFGVTRVERINDFVEVRTDTEQKIEEVENADEDKKLLWVPERNACRHCLAYAGRTRFDDGFPVGLTFDPSGPLKISGLKSVDPPLHPNCRCELMVVSGSNTDIAIGLAREARRSIARGFSLKSESYNARLRATNALLASGNMDLPKSVTNYARRSVLNREYKRGRDVPA